MSKVTWILGGAIVLSAAGTVYLLTKPVGAAPPEGVSGKILSFGLRPLVGKLEGGNMLKEAVTGREGFLSLPVPVLKPVGALIGALRLITRPDGDFFAVVTVNNSGQVDASFQVEVALTGPMMLVASTGWKNLSFGLSGQLTAYFKRSSMGQFEWPQGTYDARLRLFINQGTTAVDEMLESGALQVSAPPAPGGQILSWRMQAL